MFIGHYGVSLAAKRYDPRIPLGVLFLAVQVLDVLFAIFVLSGIEKLKIVPGFTAYNPYDLYWMPYSHSLVGALGWSVVAAVVCLLAARRLPPRARGAAAAVVGAAVFSHFLLDVPMHTPDLPLSLGAGSPKIGLGLWNHRDAALAAELVVLARRRRPLPARDPPEEPGLRARDRRFRRRARSADAGDALHARPGEPRGLRVPGAGALLRSSRSRRPRRPRPDPCILTWRGRS